MAEGVDDDTIVLTDTAPLLASGETEYLARFVDTAIVVIQSGLTTRAQLREVAQTLQRLEVAAVGFVLNRVSIPKANSSFRQSVRAVEQRLAVQNRLRMRYSPRTRPSAQHQQQAQEPIVVTEPDAVKSPDLSPPPLSPNPDPSLQAALPEQPLVPAQALSTVPEAEPAPSPRVARGRGAARRTAPVPTTPNPSQPATPPPPSSAAPSASPETATAPPRRPVPISPPSAEPAQSMEELFPAPQVNAPAGRLTPTPPPPSPPVSAGPLPEEAVSERDDAGYSAASRLGGLRNLLVSLGRRSLNENGETAEHPDIEPRFERATVRPAYADEPPPSPEAPANGATARLTAQPEFLPPKPMVEVEKDVVRTNPPRRDKADSDEIQTLPSWRGQYRKKRYPPL